MSHSYQFAQAAIRGVHELTCTWRNDQVFEIWVFDRTLRDTSGHTNVCILRGLDLLHGLLG